MPWHKRERTLVVEHAYIFELETCYYHIKPSRPEFPSELKQKYCKKLNRAPGILRVVKNVNEFGNLHLIS
jgi:hypothetical protein